METLIQNGLYSRKLFQVAWELLKPGGELVYSTCTLNPYENEMVVDWALSQLGAILVNLPTEIGFYGSPGIYSSLYNTLSRNDCYKMRRFDPILDNRDDTVGFFIAKFVK
jgi:16S rRNA C967 or C1407 C5-methylase (RsmB/RsmF family)